MPKAPLDFAIEDAQRCLRSSPVIVLGSGASAPWGLPGMGELADNLKKSDPNIQFGDENEGLWQQFLKNLESKDLENTLFEMNLGEYLSDHIIMSTWEYINSSDLTVLENIANKSLTLPLSRLYRHLFSSTHRTVSVVTPNYDRLAEYAADAAGCCHFKGFSYGYLGHRQTDARIQFTQGQQQARTVDIWKVHGCLDWFLADDGQAYSLALPRSIPTDHRPAIVTPGIEKYERTHLEPFRTIIAGADAALTRANAYLCIGFGFNDSHIQPKLLERWKGREALLVILTRTLSESARHMLAEADRQEYLAMEYDDEGTMMWSHRFPDGIKLKDCKLWSLSEFLDQTT